MSLLDLWFRKWEATCWNRRRGQTSRGEMTPLRVFLLSDFHSLSHSKGGVVQGHFFETRLVSYKRR